MKKVTSGHAAEELQYEQPEASQLKEIHESACKKENSTIKAVNGTLSNYKILYQIKFIN